MSEPLPIIDSHIHLYPSDALDSLAWHTGPDHPLTGRHSLAEYAGATGSPAAPAAPAGFVLVEADRKNDEARDWTAPLQEVSWMRRIADGHDPAGARLCRAMVPWAPVVLGPARLEAYLQEAEAVAGPAMWARVKGFRYLLQDKPAFTALADGFIEGLKVLGKRGFVFDLAVDQHRRGRAQMEEAVEMVDRAHEGVPDEEKVVFVLNHLCKPDLGLVNLTDPSFIVWRNAVFSLGKRKNTYMKLSGCFSEMPESVKTRSVEDIFESIFPWLAVVLAAFGPSRIMFASDWPVCTIGLDGAWDKWRKVVERMCYMCSLSREDQAMVWSGTAEKAYKLEKIDVLAC